MSAIRVLVVEDYEPFRRFVCSTLRKRAELQIVCEVSDGLEAVQKVEELQPELALLDMGLPSLSGIEVARRIRRLSPQTKILFVSQETSAPLVRAAFSLGAMGYVVKEHAERELLAAVEAVCQGRQFVSMGLAGHTHAATAQAPDIFRQEALPSLAQEKRESTRSHEIRFFSDDASFLTGFTRFIEAALKADNAVIVIATEPHRVSLLQRLHAHGGEVAAAVQKKHYIPLNVADTLSTFMVNGLIHPIRFAKVAGDLLAEAAKAAKEEHHQVALCWECTPTLWAQGDGDTAIQLERVLDELAKTCDVDIMCGYVLGSLEREQESQFYERICAEHSAVAPSEPAIRQP